MKVNGYLGYLLPPVKKYLMWSECPSFSIVSCSEKKNSLVLYHGESNRILDSKYCQG